MEAEDVWSWDDDEEGDDREDDMDVDVDVDVDVDEVLPALLVFEIVLIPSPKSAWFNSKIPSLSNKMSSFGSKILGTEAEDEHDGEEDLEDEREAARDLDRDDDLDCEAVVVAVVTDAAVLP